MVSYNVTRKIYFLVPVVSSINTSMWFTKNSFMAPEKDIIGNLPVSSNVTLKFSIPSKATASVNIHNSTSIVGLVVVITNGEGVISLKSADMS